MGLAISQSTGKKVGTQSTRVALGSRSNGQLCFCLLPRRTQPASASAQLTGTETGTGSNTRYLKSEFIWATAQPYVQ